MRGSDKIRQKSCASRGLQGGNDDNDLLRWAVTISDRKVEPAEHCEEATTRTDGKVEPAELCKKKPLREREAQESRSDCCEKAPP